MSEQVKNFLCETTKDCKGRFSTKLNLIKHISAVHSFPVKCPHENCEAYLKPLHLRMHIKHVHQKIKLPCLNCDRFVSMFYLDQHLESCVNSGMKKFPCTIEGCKASFSTKSGLSKHLKRTHASDPVKCPFEDCDKYVKPLGLNTHIKTVHLKIKTKCENCGKEVSYKNIKQHRVRCYGDNSKKFTCKIQGCRASFFTKTNLNYHVNGVHSLPMKCPRENCDLYIKPFNLGRHLKTVHDGIKQVSKSCRRQMFSGDLDECKSDDTRVFRCDYEHCKAKFDTEVGLRKHVKVAHNTPSMKCPYENCDLYLKPRSICSHLRRVHKICQFCGERAEDLERHKENCTRDRGEQLRCSDCYATFDSKKYLFAHYVTTHAGSNSTDKEQ